MTHVKCFNFTHSTSWPVWLLLWNIKEASFVLVITIGAILTGVCHIYLCRILFKIVAPLTHISDLVTKWYSLAKPISDSQIG